MRRTLSIVLASASIQLPSLALAELPALDRSRAGNYCEDQWTKRGNLDRKMYNYCMERQVDGYNDAMSLMKKYSSIADIDKIANYSVRKWLKARQYQYEMVAYEMERQIDSFLNVAYGVKSGDYTEADVLPCLSKWYRGDKPQWDMVAYCLERN